MSDQLKEMAWKLKWQQLRLQRVYEIDIESDIQSMYNNKSSISVATYVLRREGTKKQG